MMAENGAEILLVEDDPNDAELIKRAFKKRKMAGGMVHLKDGAEAVEYVMRYCCCDRPEGPLLPSVVLLDLKLPKLNGFEVLQRIKADGCTKSIPVVILTSSQEESDIVEAYALGANSYVTKPIDCDAFSKTVVDMGSYWLELNRTQREPEGGAR